jgi:hypothetical protein
MNWLAYSLLMYLIIENNVSNAFDWDTIVRKIYI